MPERGGRGEKIARLKQPFERRENEKIPQYKSRITRYIAQTESFIKEYKEDLDIKEKALSSWQYTLARLKDEGKGTVVRQDIKNRIQEVEKIVSELENGKEYILQEIERTQADLEKLFRYRRALDAKPNMPEDSQ